MLLGTLHEIFQQPPGRPAPASNHSQLQNHKIFCLPEPLTLPNPSPYSLTPLLFTPLPKPCSWTVKPALDHQLKLWWGGPYDVSERQSIDSLGRRSGQVLFSVRCSGRCTASPSLRAASSSCASDMQAAAAAWTPVGGPHTSHHHPTQRRHSSRLRPVSAIPQSLFGPGGPPLPGDSSDKKASEIAREDDRRLTPSTHPPPHLLCSPIHPRFRCRSSSSISALGTGKKLQSVRAMGPSLKPFVRPVAKA